VQDDIAGGIRLGYEPVPGIPKIPNPTIHKLARQLDLDPFEGRWKELERGHWAIKGVDLSRCSFESASDHTPHRC
jgi:hypothetical protein